MGLPRRVSRSVLSVLCVALTPLAASAPDFAADYAAEVAFEGAAGD